MGPRLRKAQQRELFALCKGETRAKRVERLGYYRERKEMTASVLPTILFFSIYEWQKRVKVFQLRHCEETKSRKQNSKLIIRRFRGKLVSCHIAVSKGKGASCTRQKKIRTQSVENLKHRRRKIKTIERPFSTVLLVTKTSNKIKSKCASWRNYI